MRVQEAAWRLRDCVYDSDQGRRYRLVNSHRTSSPLDLMYSMTSRAVLVMYAMSLPWLCSRRKLDVPMTTSRPSTPVSTANWASRISQRTSDRRLDKRGHRTIVTHESKSWPSVHVSPAPSIDWQIRKRTFKPSLQMVSQSLRDCSEAAGDVNSM